MDISFAHQGVEALFNLICGKLFFVEITVFTVRKIGSFLQICPGVLTFLHLIIKTFLRYKQKAHFRAVTSSGRVYGCTQNYVTETENWSLRS